MTAYYHDGSQTVVVGAWTQSSPCSLGGGKSALVTGSERQLGMTIGHIYEAAVAPEIWPDVLDEVTRAIGSDAMTLFYVDRSRATISQLQAIVGYPDGAHATWQLHFRAKDVRTSLLVNSSPGTVYADDRQIAFAEIQKTEIHNEFDRSNGMSHALGASLLAHGMCHGVIGTHRALGRGAHRPQDIVLFEALVPHLARSLQIFRQLSSNTKLIDSLASSIDKFQTALFVVDRSLTVVIMNRAAERLLREPACPVGLSNARLMPVRTADASALALSVEMAIDISEAKAREVPEILHFLRDKDQRPLSLLVSPVPRSDRLGLPGDSLALVFAAPNQRAFIDHTLLTKEFRFTLAEAHIAVELALGYRAEDIAQRRHVALATVRAQVHSLLSKTDTRSQAQLVALIWRSLAALGPVRQ